MNTFHEQVETIGRFAVSYLIMFILFILNVIFISASGTASLNIALTMMVIYYWSIYRPMLIPPVLVFTAGVCFDALSGWPLGVSAFIFLLMRQSVGGQRLFLTGQPFTVIWLGFIGAISVASLLQWIIFSIMYLQWALIYPILLTLFASIIMFPLIALALHLSHKLLPEMHDQYTAVG